MKSTHQGVIYIFLKRIARRLHATTLIERLLVVLIVWLTALLLTVSLLPLASTQAWLVTCFMVMAWVATAMALMWLGIACVQRCSLESAALYVEARHPTLHNYLISALQLPESLQKHPESGISVDLVQGLLEATHQQIGALSRQPLIDWSAVWRQGQVAALLLVAVLGVFWLAPQLFMASVVQFLHPFSLLGTEPTILILDNYPRHLLVGQPLTLQAVASGRLPATVELHIWQAGKERQEKMVVASQSTFRYTIASLREPIKFQAVAGYCRHLLHLSRQNEAQRHRPVLHDEHVQRLAE